MKGLLEMLHEHLGRGIDVPIGQCPCQFLVLVHLDRRLLVLEGGQQLVATRMLGQDIAELRQPGAGCTGEQRRMEASMDLRDSFRVVGVQRGVKLREEVVDLRDVRLVRSDPRIDRVSAAGSRSSRTSKISAASSTDSGTSLWRQLDQRAAGETDERLAQRCRTDVPALGKGRRDELLAREQLAGQDRLAKAVVGPLAAGVGSKGPAVVVARNRPDSSTSTVEAGWLAAADLDPTRALGQSVPLDPAA